MATTRALLVVDVQPTFCEGGALAVDGGNEVAEQIAAFIAAAGDRYALVVSTQDWHIDPGDHFSDEPDFVDSWPPHGIAGTDEAELHPALAGVRFDASVKKGAYEAAYSGFEGTDEHDRPLQQILSAAGVGAVDVVGIAESHCVKDTALDAVRAGLATRVISDLTVPVSPELGASARTEMAGAGVQFAAAAEAG